MAGYAGKNEHQRELEKIYNRLCYRFSRYEVWQDAIWMFACTISNAIDQRYAEEREAQYMRIVQKYSADERELFPRLFGSIINGMEEYPDCDFLGELYMGLELGNKHVGQFFTPYSLCKLMARCDIQMDVIDQEMAKHGFISVNDCACGAGATLVAAANYLREIGFNYQQDALFVAQDIDSTTALMCYIQLSFLGCAGYVIIGDTLCAPQTGNVLLGEDTSRCWFTPMFFHERWAVRRSVAQARQMFRTVTQTITQKDGHRPMFGGEAQADAGSVHEKPVCETPPEPVAQGPTFTVSTRKKNKGQLMFDFGEVKG